MSILGSFLEFDVRAVIWNPCARNEGVSLWNYAKACSLYLPRSEEVRCDGCSTTESFETRPLLPNLCWTYCPRHQPVDSGLGILVEMVG